MADRFPSIEDIDGDGGFEFGGDGADASGDFLTRERAALGADADQFAGGDGDDDLLGGGGQTNGVSDDIGQFQSSFPAIDSSNERVAPGGTITGSAAPFLPGAPSVATPTPAAASFDDGEEPEVIRSWREQRDAAIAKREDASAARKESTVKDAQQAVDDFYVNYNQKLEKQKTTTRKEAEEFLASREDTSAGGTSWERIAKLVDVRKTGGGDGGAPAGKDRFRGMLGALAKDANAPGAKGY